MPDTRTKLDDPLPQLIDIRTLAERLDVTVRHIRRLVHERRIPFIKWGHLLRFDPAEIAAWLNEARCPLGGRLAARPVRPPSPLRSPQRRRPAQVEPPRNDRSSTQLRLEP